MSDKPLINPWWFFHFWGWGVVTGILMAIYLASAHQHAVDIYTDKATGCQYLYRPHHGGITPRLDGHGHHLCTAPAVK
jgi:hypothetical protein